MNVNAIPDLNDIPRAYTAVAQWMGCALVILGMHKKINWSRFFVTGFVVLLWQIIFMSTTDDVLVVLWIPCMMLAAVNMYFFLCTCCDDTPLTVGYYCAYAFLWAEFTASLEWQLYCYFATPAQETSSCLSVVAMLAIDSVVFAVSWEINNRIYRKEKLDVSKYELITEVLITLIVFAFSNLSYLFPDTPFSAQIVHDIFWTRTLVDLCGIIILYTCHMLRREQRMEHEVSAIRMVLESQYQQYQQYKESLDVIQYKYHDIKHQIQGLRAETNMEAREKWLDDLERGLAAYEWTVKTGNKVLDTLLTGKSMYCHQHDITLTCVVDGKLLDFINSMDLCSLFGNALDNAIESVSKLKNPEERLIHVSVSAQKGFVLILVENYCEQSPKFVQGLPATTKKDTGNHGFGIKSMQYTAKKYDGAVTVEYKKNWFELKILLPR